MKRRNKVVCRRRRQRRVVRSVEVVRNDCRWSALRDCNHPLEREEATVEQEAVQESDTIQTSDETIVVRNSCDVKVTTHDTKAALNLQASLQFAIAAVLSVSIADGDAANEISQELFQKSFMKQASNHRTLIENSKGVTVHTVDTDISVNIQLLAQILAALVAKLNIG